MGALCGKPNQISIRLQITPGNFIQPPPTPENVVMPIEEVTIPRLEIDQNYHC